MSNKRIVRVEPRIDSELNDKRRRMDPRQIVWSLDYPITTRKVPTSLPAKRKQKKRCEKWTNFAGRSTCAALTHLGEEYQPTPVKIIWRMTLFAGLILTAVSTYFSAKSFLNLSGNSEMVLQTDSVGWIEHPNYHICTSNTFNLTILKEMGFVDDEMISYLILSTSLFAMSQSLVDNVERQRQLEIKFNKIIDQNGFKDIAEILQQAVLKCEEIIAGCISPGVYLSGVECCKTFFPTGSFVSRTGACVTTFSAPPIIQRIASSGFGFVVIVKDSRDSSGIVLLDNSIVNPVMANQRGVTFSMTDKWTDPTVALSRDKHYTRIGLWTSVAISRTTINDEEIMQSLIASKMCAQRNEQNKFIHLVPGFSNYTQNNCLFAFRQKIFTETFNCHMATLPYKGDFPTCRPQEILNFARQFFNKKETMKNLLPPESMPGCVNECWKETYAFSASYADLQLASNFQFGNWTFTQNQSNQLAALNFFYPTFTQNLLVNHYPTVNQGLGILGGNLGLYLGASMVTFIEVVVFVFGYCFSFKRV